MDEFQRWWGQSASRRRDLARDEPLFHRGDPVKSMFRVEAGHVRLERRTIDGRLLVLFVAGPGDLIAEASLFAESYHCDASAAEPSAVSFCARRDVMAAMTADPFKTMHFARLIARQLQAARHKLEFRNVRSARERTLLFFELNADPESRCFALAGKWQDIASDIGLTREAFYRALAALEREGAIERRTQTILLRRPHD